MNREPIDDLDRLFGRLDQLAPPADFVAGVMTQTRPARRVRLLPWVLLDLVAVAVLAFAGFDLGQQLADGAVTLLFDPELITSSPLTWLFAVSEIAPILSVLLFVVAASAVVVTTRGLIQQGSRAA